MHSPSKFHLSGAGASESPRDATENYSIKCRRCWFWGLVITIALFLQIGKGRPRWREFIRNSRRGWNRRRKGKKGGAENKLRQTQSNVIINVLCTTLWMASSVTGS